MFYSHVWTSCMYWENPFLLLCIHNNEIDMFSLMYWLDVFLETTLVYEFLLTILTLMCFTLVYWLYVSIETTLSCCFILTILTLKCCTFMYGLCVSLERTLCFEFKFTVLALKCFTFMYTLYVSTETILVCKIMQTNRALMFEQIHKWMQIFLEELSSVSFI